MRFCLTPSNPLYFLSNAFWYAQIRTSPSLNIVIIIFKPRIFPNVTQVMLAVWLWNTRYLLPVLSQYLLWKLCSQSVTVQPEAVIKSPWIISKAIELLAAILSVRSTYTLSVSGYSHNMTVWSTELVASISSSITIEIIQSV